MVPRLVFLEMDRADIVTGGWRVEAWVMSYGRIEVDTGTNSDDSDAGPPLEG